MNPSSEQHRNLGFLVSGVYRLYGRLFERHSKELGLSLAECRVLAFLSRNEGASQARIAEGTDTEPMTLVRILDRMERDAWIERRVNSADRRAHRLFLRAAATPILTRMWELTDQVGAQVLATLSGEERLQLVHLLEKSYAQLLSLEGHFSSRTPPVADGDGHV